ncbi:MAG: hypothetical protein E3J76_02575 [Candidatus Aminicenantes bacterium]|nr:MAG: hypothetical protein E3J76_02575 [Candidatus Aminicenantes bacterium]
MGKIIRILSVFSLALLLVIGFSSCEKTRGVEGFDGTLQVTNNSDFTVLVEIDGTVEKSDLGPNSQWSKLLRQGPYTVKIRKIDGSDENVYQVDIISLGTVAISYP